MVTATYNISFTAIIVDDEVKIKLEKITLEQFAQYKEIFKRLGNKLIEETVTLSVVV